ncbi:MAG: alpha-glucuronidase, partial [Lachnospiraceae bacterium]|nr:alpha-glucuronidase [Lachnospiraceae bacterium]
MGFEQAWLNYTEKTSCEGVAELQYICVDIVEDFQPEKTGSAAFGADELIESGVRELQNALEGMTGSRPVFREQPDGGAGKGIHLLFQKGIPAEGYRLSEKDGDVTIAASDSRGMLYGIFALLRQIRLGKTIRGMALVKAPDMPLRMLNHWDNMDGSIERGYAGESFFFQDNEILINDRTVTYARLAASVGINAVVINNVNVKDAATWLITERYLGKVRELNEIFAGYGIKLFLSLNYAAPVELGELESADPLD